MSHQKWLLQTPEKEPTSTKNNHPQNHQNNKKKNVHRYITKPQRIMTAIYKHKNGPQS